MSHKVIWEEVAAGRKELALVLEDDAVILPSFRDRIPLIVAELPETWDILYLGSGQYEIETAISPHLARPSRIFGLFGYVINWRGAERLLKRVFPLRYQIDTELWRNFSTLDPLLAVPFIVGENKERSDVGPAFFTKISFLLVLDKGCTAAEPVTGVNEEIKNEIN
jgi:GR25 family glycosyltransferase involved in LPS biosynthesis